MLSYYGYVMGLNCTIGGEDYFNHMAGGFVDLHDNNASVFGANGSYVRAHPGRLSGLSASHSKAVFCMALLMT
jgi:hypothetical protein